MVRKFLFRKIFYFSTTGIVLLDLEEQKIECIYEAIINDAIANGQLNKDVKDELLRLLTSNHQYKFAFLFLFLFENIFLDILNLVHLDVDHQ
jgi:hypothetical protein